MKDFKGKVAVITGAAGGIGSGLAEKCAREGMKVVLADIEKPALEEVERTLEANGAEVLAVPTDVSKLSDVEALAEKAVDRFGGVHLLFNNAGVSLGATRGKPFWEITLADWRWVTGVNLWGVIHGIKVFLPVMLRPGTEGHVVNTGSIAGLISGASLGIYKATKAAVIMISETLYLQLRQRRLPIGVTVACPSFVRSRLNEAERNRPPEFANPSASPLTEAELAVIKRFEQGNRHAMPPAEFAGIVFEAIRKDQLFLLSHPEAVPTIRRRCEDILNQRNPDLPDME
jgi:NAD(P)-dependent dehydrogenase (short-subunit alcohol dehydrogenase family)